MMHNLRHFYSDLKMIGRHFVLSAESLPKHKRQYTICNAMIPDVQNYLMSLCDPEKAADAPPAPDAISGGDVGSLWLTAKNYQARNGVATALFHNSESVYSVKGPMGKGCNVQTEGVHMAFAGGTGALVYLDLVARLILQNTGNLPKGAEPFGESFVFHFFVSFATRKDAIGLDLCEALVALNKQKGH